MAKHYEAVQKVYGDFVSSVHKKVYGLTSNGTTILTTNHAFYKSAVISAKLKQAEFIKEHGKGSDYSVTTFDTLHVASQREGYGSIKQDANCVLLYKEGKPEQFDKPEHSTIILTKTAQEQVEYIGDVLNNHCANYNIDLRRGLSYSEAPYINVTGAYKEEEMGEINAHSRSDLAGLEVRLTQGPLYDFIESEFNEQAQEQ